jgi:hypothetical protein
MPPTSKKISGKILGTTKYLSLYGNHNYRITICLSIGEFRKNEKGVFEKEVGYRLYREY